MRRLKRLCFTLMMAGVFLPALNGLSQAATSQNVDIHVSIAGTKSLVIQGATFYDFGALSVNTSSVSASAITVQNNSTVFVETYTITGADATSDTGGTDWTLAASTGTDQYALAAQFSTARPTDDNSSWSSDDLATSPSSCSSTTHGNGTLAESGEGVGISETRSLWFRMKTPSAVTDGDEHTVTVTVSVL